MAKIAIKCVHLEGADRDVALPAYETDEAAGADIRANLPKHARSSGLTIAMGQRLLVPTGLRVEIPQGFEMQIRPRSGLALKHGITVINAPGTIDSDYRGPLGIILGNLGETDFLVEHGARIAQVVIAPVVQSRFQLAQAVSVTERGSDGFGSTGTQ